MVEYRHRVLGYLAIGKFQIDVKTPRRAAAGCVAIKVNRTVLLSREFEGKEFFDIITRLAEENGFEVVEMPSLVQLRATLGSGEVPQVKVWQDTIRAVTKKVFRRGPVSVDDLRHLSRLRDLVDTNRMRPEIAEARLFNAFRYNGEMTHALLKWTEPKKNGRKCSFVKFFPNADDAMADYLARADVADYTILEFDRG